ncbi:nucleotidyltransferase domain-containing protein [Anaerobacillus sp. CMMVII]|nr:nucleotidyltransferase domain-containing protein [Anaerobacillus sp. CMMVII]
MINQQLQLVENTHNVKIIFACEAGSRSTGLDTENSDYDVRFLYIRPIKWYLSIDKKMMSFPYRSMIRSIFMDGIYKRLYFY